MSDLFASQKISEGEVNDEQENHSAAHSPLADRMRPKSLGDIVGQDHLCGRDGILTRLVAAGSFGNMIFWGPPGSGKTTVARLLASEVNFSFRQISAIFSGVSDLKKLFEYARQNKQYGRTVLLFVDEIHRFNRAQLDSFLPVMEDGTIVLVGATTGNPSFELNAALLSRANILIFRPHTPASLALLLEQTEKAEDRTLPLDADARATLIRMADGDGRAVLSLAEDIWRIAREGTVYDTHQLQEILQRRAPIHDKGQDGHYNLISALHKSVRGSDPDAALYYLTRMLDAGEDRHFIARRLIRMASEDIGNADPQALVIAISAKESFDFLGIPEGDLALAQACVYMATAPKSNAIYAAYGAALKAARKYGSLSPPKVILNAPTKLMKEQGYGEGYRYDHDEEDAFSGQDHFPEKMDRKQFYDPPQRGFERKISKRLKYWKELRREHKRKNNI